MVLYEDSNLAATPLYRVKSFGMQDLGSALTQPELGTPRSTMPMGPSKSLEHQLCTVSNYG